MPEHTVSQGECLTSIAAQYGFAVKTLWNLPENANLKLIRKDPNVLFPGDVVFVPEVRLSEVSCSADQRHTFVKKGEPTKLRIRLLDDQRPRANVSYRLQIDGVWVNGTTDGSGYLEQPLSPSAQKGLLLVGEEATQDVHDLDFGYLDPIDQDSGVARRLHNLGYETGDSPSEAIRGFQRDHGLDPKGQIDDLTRQKLIEVFGQ